MLKMPLERFREIKRRTREIKDLIDKIQNEENIISDEETEEIEKELISLSDEIHSSELSEIPFEEYEGFFDCGFDFEGTGANLDFKIIDASAIYYNIAKLKGCNIRNFDFDNHRYNEDSFDEDFKKEHSDMFLTKEVPADVKDRYCARYLSVEDVLRYELQDEISQTRISENTKAFFDRVPLDVAKTMDLDIYTDDTIGRQLRYNIRKYDGQITKDVLEELIKETVEYVFYESYLSLDDYKAITSIPKVREMIPEEDIIDFGELKVLGKNYLEKRLSIEEISNNLELFREKNFIQRLKGYKDNLRKYEGITEEKLYYLFDNYPDIFNGLISYEDELFSIVRIINPELSNEENFSEIQAAVGDILNGENEFDIETSKSLSRYYSIESIKKNLSEYDQYRFDSIMKYTTPEKIASYGITAQELKDARLVVLFSTYGLETVMEFDKANGNIFSKDNFDLAKKIDNYYFHYGANEHDPNRSIYTRTDSPQEHTEPFKMEDFEEIVRRMIVFGPSDGEYSRVQPIDFRNFSSRFKEKNPRMFLDDNAPEELKDKFYTKNIKIEDLGLNTDWIDFLEGKDYEIGLQIPEIMFTTTTYSDMVNLKTVLDRLENSESNILKFLNENNKTIKMLEMYCQSNSWGIQNSLENIQSLDDFRNLLETELENKILSGALEYGDIYLPEFFKERHPEFVLDENAPEELKAKFYSLYYEEGYERNRAELHKFTLEDLVNEEYKPFLNGKSFELLKNSEQVRNITKIFDLDTIKSLYEIDPDAFEIYCFNIENANALKVALDFYPENFAREELMHGLKLSAEELEDRLLTDDEVKAKFDAFKKGYIEDLIHNPGYLLNLEPQKRSRETLKQYKALSSTNMLKNSNRYSRDSYEQILGNMLGFIGFEESRKLLKEPKIDEETLDRIYQREEAIKSLYEKKFEITGNIKVIGKLLEGIPTLMPNAEKITSKETCKVFMSINKRIMQGYNKDIESLLKEALEENGIKIDEEKVSNLTQKVVDISTSQKLELVREKNSVLIDSNIGENQKTKNMIKMHYRDALEYSLNKSEKIDFNLVREYLEKEFSRVREDNGQAYYSPHVTEHLEELVEFAKELGLDAEWNEKLNHTVVDDLKTEAGKIGKGWIRKITSNVCFKPEKITYEEAEKLDLLLYPEGSGLEVDTKATIGLRKLSEDEKEKLYAILNNEQARGIFTYSEAESMFSTLNPPYSERFKEFFLKNKEEFIQNPDLFTNFTIMASKFDSYLEDIGFYTRYTEGTLEPKDILLKLSQDIYPNLKIGAGEHELIYKSKSAGLSEEQVEVALKLFKDMKKREYQTIPQEEYTAKRFRGRIVRIDDPLHFSVGKITNCCQTIGVGQPGETSMIHSATERNGSLFVVEELDETGKPMRIVAQSWTWRNGNRVCFDNVEIPVKVEEEFKEIGGFDEIMEVYQETAKRMIETDKIKLRKLVEEGKITEEQFKSMVIKDVSMGVGCDDLISNLSDKKNAKFDKIKTVYPLEIGTEYIGADKRTLYVDSEAQILISHNDNFDPNDHVHTNEEVGNYGVKYLKTRDIYRRKGHDIDSDKIEVISNRAQKSNRKSTFSSEPINIYEVISKFRMGDCSSIDIDNIRMNMSENGDWYILFEETDKGIMIHETDIDLSKQESELEKLDRKMALGEYTREMYQIMLEAASKGKLVTIDSYSTDTLLDLEPLIKDDIISVKDGTITVKEPSKLTEKVESYSKVLDNQRRERLVTEPANEQER